VPPDCVNVIEFPNPAPVVLDTWKSGLGAVTVISFVRFVPEI